MPKIFKAAAARNARKILFPANALIEIIIKLEYNITINHEEVSSCLKF